jgi:hypothetical protein
MLPAKAGECFNAYVLAEIGRIAPRRLLRKTKGTEATSGHPIP